MIARPLTGRAPAIVLALALAFPASGAAEPTPADRAIAEAGQRVRRAGSADAYVSLASAFMRKARETGAPDHYDRAGAAIDRALALEPDSHPAFRARAWVLLGQHRFGAALRVARESRRREPADWWNYGNLADASIELGYYRSAARATARMVALRPGVPAYARVAAVRALTGDRRGAIAALELARDAAGATDAEERAWLLVHLGHEHWELGDVAAATGAYEAALAAFPDHHLALAALGRARAVAGRTIEAIAAYERALDLVPSPSVAGALGDLYAAAGDPIRARATYDLAVYMGRIATARGVSLGRELALFLADHDRELDQAVALARVDAARRDDVYTHDALAWALYKRGDTAAAKRSIARALRLGTEDATFHRHAAAIASARGRTRVAARHERIARALGGVA